MHKEYVNNGRVFPKEVAARAAMPKMPEPQQPQEDFVDANEEMKVADEETKVNVDTDE